MSVGGHRTTSASTNDIDMCETGRAGKGMCVGTSCCDVQQHPCGCPRGSLSSVVGAPSFSVEVALSRLGLRGKANEEVSAERHDYLTLCIHRVFTNSSARPWEAIGSAWKCQKKSPWIRSLARYRRSRTVTPPHLSRRQRTCVVLPGRGGHAPSSDKESSPEWNVRGEVKNTGDLPGQRSLEEG